MLDQQLDAYPGREEFLFALLGAYALFERSTWLLSLTAPDTSAKPDPALIDCALGWVALARTVQARLHLVPPAEADAAPGMDPHARWLR